MLLGKRMINQWTKQKIDDTKTEVKNELRETPVQNQHKYAMATCFFLVEFNH
jgi:hypothetical protein